MNPERHINFRPERHREAAAVTILSDEDLLDWIGENAEAIATICDQCPPDTPVPTCSGWALSDLLAHVSPLLSGWYSTTLTAQPGQFDMVTSFLESGPPIPDEHDKRIAYLLDGAQALRNRADEVDLNAPVWAFGGVSQSRFWLRRAATETAVHRWDAEVAGPGATTTIDPIRAAESLDETIRVMWPAIFALDWPKEWPLSSDFELPSVPIGILATDSGHSWRLRLRNGAVEVLETAELPDTIAEATGHELVLYVWGRITSDQLQITGSPEVVNEWNIGQRIENPSAGSSQPRPLPGQPSSQSSRP
jgi:hypothetical protein